MDHGNLSAAADLEANPQRLFPAWHPPFYLSIIVFVLWFLYNTLSGYVIYGPRVSHPVRGTYSVFK